MDLPEQHLFRFFMYTQACDFDKAQDAYQNIVNALQCDEGSVKECIGNINSSIKRYDLEITECKSEISAKKLLVLINTAQNNISKHAKFHDKKTLNFFSKILRSCVLAEGGATTEIECINLSNQVEISKSNAQNLLKQFVDQYWLEETDGKIYLGARTIAEFQQVLIKDFSQQVKHCPLCKICLVHGEFCQSCNCKIHKQCIQKYLQVNTLCPECKKPWIAQPNVADSSESDDDDRDVSKSKRSRAK